MSGSIKVGVVGLGNVGVTTAFAMLFNGAPNELVLVSRDKKKAEGEALDLEHALPFLESANIIPTDNYKDLEGCRFIVVTAGAAQKPGETRLDLVNKNSKIIEDIIPKIMKYAPDSVVLIVSNPVDILTFKANKIAKKAAPGQIFGSGTILDTARFRTHLSDKLKVNPGSIHAYILGEHGDSSFPVISSASVGGQNITELKNFSMQYALDAYEQARSAAYKIIEAKGATYYAIAAAVVEIMNAVLRDEETVLPVSVPLDNYYGLSDVALSIPCVIGKNGVERQLMASLSEEEVVKMYNSAKTLQEFLK
ncbi:MAG: L-lactate dehydrogenase [Candidatus Pacebacteria bacterium]|nr:L-lactate dehydrogenase [Candidatus Paceibacterota bacterium]